MSKKAQFRNIILNRNTEKLTNDFGIAKMVFTRRRNKLYGFAAIFALSFLKSVGP